MEIRREHDKLSKEKRGLDALMGSEAISSGMSGER
jgi:hypothetical protein